MVGYSMAGSHSVSQHVRMDRKAQLGDLARPLKHAKEACRAERRAAFGGEYENRLGLLLAL